MEGRRRVNMHTRTGTPRQRLLAVSAARCSAMQRESSHTNRAAARPACVARTPARGAREQEGAAATVHALELLEVVLVAEGLIRQNVQRNLDLFKLSARQLHRVRVPIGMPHRRLRQSRAPLSPTQVSPVTHDPGDRRTRTPQGAHASAGPPARPARSFAGRQSAQPTTR